MTLRLAFIVDPLPTLKPEKDSTIAMLRAAERRGHEIHAIDRRSLAWESGDNQGRVFGESVRLATRPGPAWYRERDRALSGLTEFDAVLMRKDPPFDIEYIAATWLLERAEAAGARVFNRPQALREHSEKLAIAEFAPFIAPSRVARDIRLLDAFIDEQEDVILKPLDGMGGSQIFRVRRDDPNRNVILETLTCSGNRTIMAQRYLPAIAQGDKRILLIAGQAVPFCLARIPKTGETRGNLAAGGHGLARELSARDREIAETLGPLLWQRGLLLVGIDVIGEHLTEINVTSPTGMVEIERQTGFDAAGALIAALERACAADSHLLNGSFS